jgi:diguanylate cyclase (GGDEF)-like protein
MMILSPDHLDEYEASHGREATAAMLKSVALVIRESLRDCDIPALYAEMEMIVLLPDTPLTGATIAAERIRQRTLELKDTDQDVRLSLSIGVSSLSPEAQTAEEMIGSAQKQLQESRQAGGNCIRPKVNPNYS